MVQKSQFIYLDLMCDVIIRSSISKKELLLESITIIDFLLETYIDQGRTERKLIEEEKPRQKRMLEQNQLHQLTQIKNR